MLAPFVKVLLFFFVLVWNIYHHFLDPQIGCSEKNVSLEADQDGRNGKRRVYPVELLIYVFHHPCLIILLVIIIYTFRAWILDHWAPIAHK